jgi:hypothetical protein
MRRNPISRLLSAIGVLATCMLATTAFAAPQYATPYRPGAGDRGSVMRCESSDDRSHECALGGYGRARLVRQLSSSPCVEGQTWRAAGGRVWVTRGCRGEFVAIDEQDDSYGNAGRIVRCESNDGRARRCALETNGRVELVRSLSDAACIEGRTWGSDREGIWVDRGCRAEFRSVGYAGGRTIRCESDDGRYRQCSADVRGGVRLLRQLSDARCTEGRTWGANREGVWVNDGCRAEFETGYRGNNGWGLGQYGGNDRYGQGFGYSGRSLRCESEDGRTHRCNVVIQGGARLQRQLSDTRCLQGSNWGWDRSGIWVGGGCRAEFAIW